MNFGEKLHEAVRKAHERGIPLPLIRDNGRGSLTATMFWVSFNIAIFLLAGKVTKLVGDVDYNNVMWLLGLTGGFYLGRKVTGDGKKISVEGKDPRDELK